MGLRSLRALIMDNSNITYLEENLLADLPQLQFVGLDVNVNDKSIGGKKHLHRFHHSRKYQWLRNYFDQRPDLIGNKILGELMFCKYGRRQFGSICYSAEEAFRKDVPL